MLQQPQGESASLTAAAFFQGQLPDFLAAFLLSELDALPPPCRNMVAYLSKPMKWWPLVTQS
jgi:hypothetical protein